MIASACEAAFEILSVPNVGATRSERQKKERLSHGFLVSLFIFIFLTSLSASDTITAVTRQNLFTLSSGLQLHVINPNNKALALDSSPVEGHQHVPMEKSSARLVIRGTA